MAKRKQKIYDEDDGRTIADMSDIERQPLIIPRFDRLKSKPAPEQHAEEQREIPEWEQTGMNREQRRAFVGGALSAAVAIAAVFAAAIGIAIFLISHIGH